MHLLSLVLICVQNTLLFLQLTLGGVSTAAAKQVCPTPRVCMFLSHGLNPPTVTAQVITTSAASVSSTISGSFQVTYGGAHAICVPFGTFASSLQTQLNTVFNGLTPAFSVTVFRTGTGAYAIPCLHVCYILCFG